MVAGPDVMTSDKAYSAELRLNQLWNHLGPAPAGTGNGQRISRVIKVGQTITPTATVTVNDGTVFMSWAVVPGDYLISGMVNWLQGAGANGQNNGFAGTCTVSDSRIANRWTIATGFNQGTAGNQGDNTRELTGSPGLGASPAWAAG